MPISQDSLGLPNLPLTLRRKLARDPLFVALDRDGTLVPICQNPELAVLTDRDQKTITTLANCPNVSVAIVSARSGERLKSDFAEPNLIIAGNYGLEIHYPNAPSFLHPQAQACRNCIKALKQDLLSLLPPKLPYILDDHVFSLCLHYHLLEEEERIEIAEHAKELSAKYAEVELKQLPTSFEFLPKLTWSKAHGLEEIHNFCGFRKKAHLCLYIGDSSADEPAFSWTNTKKGISILIGSENSEGTAAAYNLDSPKETMLFLEKLIYLRTNS